MVAGLCEGFGSGRAILIEEARVEEDHSRYWLEIHLTQNGDEKHDMRKPVRLVTAEGKVYKPAKVDFAGNPEKGFTDIWLSFWLEKKDLEKNLNLKMNDGQLKVKTGGEAPTLTTGEEVFFKTSDWEKSWLGF